MLPEAQEGVVHIVRWSSCSDAIDEGLGHVNCAFFSWKNRHWLGLRHGSAQKRKADGIREGWG
jgi:hypothetical protein